MDNKPEASFWKNAIFYTLLQRVSLFAFGVISYMILVRGFSTSTNGVWALYITIFSIFESIKQGLLRNATIKFLGLTENAEKTDEVQFSSILINIAFSLAIILCFIAGGGIIASFLKSISLAELLGWSSIIILLLIPYNHCEILLQATLRFDVLFKAAFIRQGIFFICLLLVYFFVEEGFTLFNVLMFQVLSLTAALIYILGESKHELPDRYVYNKQLTLDLVHFGKYTLGTNLFSGISRSLDHFVTAGILGPIEGKNYVAYYNTVARINNMVDVPSLAAADVLFPKNVEALENEGMDKVRHYFEQVIATIIAFIVPVSVIIFLLPGTVIDIVAGSKYEPAVRILQLTILFSMVRPLSYQFGSTLDAIGRPDINFWANAGLMFINLLLTLVFVQVYGGIGAAYAIMINYTISFVMMIIILKKYIDIDFRIILRSAVNRYSFLTA
jgi:O-antigen/teichoic acid export membrane protein